MEAMTNGNFTSTNKSVFVPREVMLFMGDVGVGKTTAALDIVRDNSNNIFHYMIADRDPSKLYMEMGGKPDNLIEYDAFEYANARDVVKQLVEATKYDPHFHWIIVDTITQMYKTAGDAFAQMHYGKSISQLVTERIMRQRVLNETGKATKEDDNYARSLFGGLQAAEWNIIKQYFYGDIVWPLIKKTRAHLIMICHPQPIDVFGMGDRAKIKRQVPEYLNGVKHRVEELGEVPDLHKDIPKFVDTWMFFSVAADSTKRMMYTLKDTGPRVWLNQPTEYKRFWSDYQRLVIQSYVPNATT